MAPGLIDTDERQAGRPAGGGLRYRPHLDGLRTIAVYLVVAYHAELGVFSGGFIGVDIFFVLSGYLVTQILVRDLASVGRIRGGNFYARRVRRILPASIITLVVTAVAYSLVASPAEMLDSIGSFRAAFFFVTNWYFIGQANDYFAANVNSNPVLQFWSLAIEEQFYLAWPALLAGLYVLTAKLKRQWWVLRTIVLAAAAASMVLALSLQGPNLARAYYGTDTRAYQLLFGAALALTPQLFRLGGRFERIARWTSSIALVALLALATSLLSLGPISRGIVVAVLAAAMLIALENARGGPAKQLLSSTPFTYLGRISYGVYLWHWPIIVIAGYHRDLSPLELLAISGVGATILAALSYRFVEQPIRMAKALSRYKTPVIAVGFASSILIGIFVMPALLDQGGGQVSALPGAAQSQSQSGLRLLDWRKAPEDRSKLPDCLGQPVTECAVVHGGGKKVLLMGDSDAWAWLPAITEVAKQRGWEFSAAVFPTCPWERGLHPVFSTYQQCIAHQEDWYKRVLPKLDPDMIILTHQALDAPGRNLLFAVPGRGGISQDTPGYVSTIEDLARASLQALARPGREIVILEPIPDPKDRANPVTCLSTGASPASCAYKVDPSPSALELFYREQARRPGVTSVDADRIVCPRWPTCDAVVGNIIVKQDENHLTATYARSVGPQLGEMLPK